MPPFESPSSMKNTVRTRIAGVSTLMRAPLVAPPVAVDALASGIGMASSTRAARIPIATAGGVAPEREVQRERRAVEVPEPIRGCNRRLAVKAGMGAGGCGGGRDVDLLGFAPGASCLFGLCCSDPRMCRFVHALRATEA